MTRQFSRIVIAIQVHEFRENANQMLIFCFKGDGSRCIFTESISENRISVIISIAGPCNDIYVDDHRIMRLVLCT